MGKLASLITETFTFNNLVKSVVGTLGDPRIEKDCTAGLGLVSRFGGWPSVCHFCARLEIPPPPKPASQFQVAQGAFAAPFLAQSR